MADLAQGLFFVLGSLGSIVAIIIIFRVWAYLEGKFRGSPSVTEK